MAAPALSPAPDEIQSVRLPSSAPLGPTFTIDGTRPPPNVLNVDGTPRGSTDSEILLAIRRGDSTAFDALVLTQFESLWRFAFSILHSRETAQDAVQDVFLNVWERRESFVVTTSLSAYLFGAVRRRALMYLRNERTAQRIAAAWTLEDLPAMSPTTPSPLLAIEQRDRTALLAQAVSTLPLIRRQILALRWDRHMSYDEIAEAMEISSESARAHVSRSYHTLRTLLQAVGVELAE